MIEFTKKHNFLNEFIFRFKSILLIGNRFVRNGFSTLHHFKDDKQLLNEPIISFSESDLWNLHDNKENWILTAGKVENIRIASKQLNGLEIKANNVFSFWKHIGNPNFGKGYVIGREIREGCIVPTIAGGLCQLSNALYDAALKANFVIIERHKHTQVIKGSLAEKNRDATVKWNYIDLRFKSSNDFRIEIEITSDKLIVVFRSKQKNHSSKIERANYQSSNKLNDCYSCGNSACFKHPGKIATKQKTSVTTYILDERWPEFDSYIQSRSSASDYYIVPSRRTAKILLLRFFSKSKNNVFKLHMQLDKTVAEAAAAKIPVTSTHLVISQNLLPFIFETGALSGRTFDVLMTRLPIEKLQDRLDFALAKYNQSPTLKDYRASQEVINLENKALTKASKVVTTHSDIATFFNNKVEKLNWSYPPSKIRAMMGIKILFPASALARKGAYEIRQLARELDLQLVIAGNAIEKDNFWEGLAVEKFNGDFNEIALLVYPTYIEHQPRLILKAISNGIPVITTAACGLDKSENVQVLEIGNFEQLRQAVLKKISK